jgi:hypothetical protein
MEKKVNEEREAAFQAALAEARSSGVSEAAAQQAAIHAANEAAENSEFLRMSENLSGDAQAKCGFQTPQHHSPVLTRMVCSARCALRIARTPAGPRRVRALRFDAARCAGTSRCRTRARRS